MLLGMPYDRPGRRLRRPDASTPCGSGAPRRTRIFDFAEFCRGRLRRRRPREGRGRVADARPLSRRLHAAGAGAAVRPGVLPGRLLAGRHRRAGSARRGNDWRDLPDKVAIQLNDTHPAMAVAELMRILLDQAQPRLGRGLGPDRAAPWPTPTTRCCPRPWRSGRSTLFEIVMPRHLEIIYEINRRFLDDVRRRYPGDEDRVGADEPDRGGPGRQVRMAHLAIVGTHSTNGVAAIHSRAAARHGRARLRRDVPRAVQQQDQRRHAAALAAAGQPATWPS